MLFSSNHNYFLYLFFLVVWGPWKQCVDENTNHPYYWNTVTNEVSWTLPEDVMKQYESQMKPEQNKEKPTVVEKKTKPKPTKAPKKEKTVSKTEDLLLSRTSLKGNKSFCLNSCKPHKGVILKILNDNIFQLHLRRKNENWKSERKKCLPNTAYLIQKSI